MGFDQAKVFNLAVGIIGVYSVYSFTGILQESIIKSTYRHDVTGQYDSLSYPYINLFFVGFFSYALGTLYNWITLPSEKRIAIPWPHGLKCGGCVVGLTVCYSYAIKLTNFPVVMMIRSCSLLSVVLVGVLFTGVSDTKLKLGARKVVVALVATVGMIVFKVFDPNQKEDDKHTQLLGIALMVLSMLGEGFLPDFQAVIKQDYKPQPTVLLVFVNKWTTLLTVLYSLAMGHLWEIFDFVRHHQAMLIDNLMIGVLCFVGQVFIYRLVRQFKQHIVPFVINTRKIFTVALSIFYFGHHFNWQQVIGILIVLFSSTYEFLGEVQRDISAKGISAKDTSAKDTSARGTQIKGEGGPVLPKEE